MERRSPPPAATRKRSPAYRRGIDVAQAKGDRQAEKEMSVFARRLERAG